MMSERCARYILTCLTSIIVVAIAIALASSPYDLAISRAVTYIHDPVADAFFKYYTNYGDYILGIGESVLLVYLYFIRKERNPLVYTLIVAIFSYLVADLLITNLLKTLIEQPRPFVSDPSLVPYIIGFHPSDYGSMPSGHASAAFAMAIPLFYYFFDGEKRYYASLPLIFAGLMGFSRIYCVAHYTSDVLIGALIGWLTAYFLFMYFRSYVSKKLSP